MTAVHPPLSAAPVRLPHTKERMVEQRTRTQMQSALGGYVAPEAFEQLVFATTTHWVRYIPQSLICGLLMSTGGIAAVLSLIILRSFPAVAAVAYSLGAAILLFTFHKFFHLILSERMRSIVVTNKRVIYMYPQLFFAENEYEIPLRRITDVSVQKVGLFRNLLDYGTLCFEAPGSDAAVRRCIPYVPRPEYVAQRIAALLPPATVL